MVTNEEIMKFMEEHPDMIPSEIPRAMLLEAANNGKWIDEKYKERVVKAIMNAETIPTLYILCGPAGCGKTTWADKFTNEYDVRYVSRDAIRYSLLEEDDNYFAHEKETFRKFSATIAYTLVDGFSVIADATHLNEISRYKLTRAIDQYTKNYYIVYVVFEVPESVSIERNNQRDGYARVPEKVIKQMYNNFQEPTLSEDYRTIGIMRVGV